MSDLLNSASLVVIPSGYKEDTVYSVVPSDGSGDLSFTRASNGTRVNSAGLVEDCPWNLVEYSEDFTNVFYTKVDCTVTANSTTAPNGTNTADSLLDNTSNFIHALTPALSKATTEITYTHSVYAKFKDTDRKIQLSLDDAVSGGIDSGVFNLSTGVWDTALGTPTAAFTNPSRNFENVGNGWYRISLTVTSNAGSAIRPNIFVINGSNASLYIGNGTGIYIWGAQLNIGSTAKPYFPTTDRLNVPRLTYQNGGGGCPSLLLEKQSTNLIEYSEDFSGATWTNEDIIVSTNQTISPDGTQNADKLIANTTTLDHSIYQTSSGSTRTFSVYAKAGEYNYIFLGSNNNVASDGAFFNLSNGTISQNTSGLTASIESVGNGWYRCIVSSTSWPTIYTIICLSTNGTSLQFTGNNTSGIYVWGVQVEESIYATSLIPTTSASATRVADACYKTGISSLIGQTEGVMFVDFELKAYDSLAKWIAFLGSGSYYIGLYTDGNSRFVAEVYDGAIQFVNQTFTFSVGQRYKIAIAYKANDFAFYINGTQIATDSSGTVPTTSAFSFEYNSTAAQLTTRIYNQSALFKTRLTNAELASLTTI